MSSDKWANINEYYYDAFASEYRDIWGGVDLTKDEITWRCYYRALVVFLQSDPEAVRDRRRLLYAYLAPEFKTDSNTDTLNRYRKQLPVDSTIRRTIKNMCTAYDADPERVFSESEAINDAMAAVYESMGMASKMQNIYHRAKLTKYLLARPSYYNGRWDVDYMTPEQFTVTTDPNDWRTVVSVTYPQADARGEIEYVTWTADTVSKRNGAGKEMTTDDNPYGRIPFVALRLGDDQDIYTGGMFELVEAQLDINKMKWLANVSATFTGSPVWFGVNLETPELTISSDKVILINGVQRGEGADADPFLEAISPDSSYAELSDFARIREQMMQQNEGIPASMVSDAGGQPPSGVARLIERQELTEQRYADQKNLRAFEREFAEMVATVARVDAGMGLNADMVDLAINYADEGVIAEPAEEYAFDKTKLADGVMSIEEFARKWAGIEENAAAVIAERKSLMNPQAPNTENNLDE